MATEFVTITKEQFEALKAASQTLGILLLDPEDERPSLAALARTAAASREAAYGAIVNNPRLYPDGHGARDQRLEALRDLAADEDASEYERLAHRAMSDSIGDGACA
jgi:hypothetical protein